MATNPMRLKTIYVDFDLLLIARRVKCKLFLPNFHLSPMGLILLF